MQSVSLLFPAFIWCELLASEMAIVSLNSVGHINLPESVTSFGLQLNLFSITVSVPEVGQMVFCS